MIYVSGNVLINIKIEYLDLMPNLACSQLDGFKAKTPLRGTSSSLLSVLATVMFPIALLALLIPYVVAYAQGIYHQSLFYSQQPISNNLYIPTTFKTAIVFYSKSTQTIANHSYLSTISNFNTYLNTITGSTFKDGILSCNPNYFDGAINSMTLTDCFIFPDGKFI